ncbi:glycosyltransferase family 4 protein [Ferruginibacter sp. SUN002]|uniref:glycosyltransferase family 4 protein n=1 Tax=Ferruginibacter sp. SUN002 TaxID=2937789 RepID=UPI003D35F3D5
MSKKKILILIDWFVPGYKAGGPIQSCVNLVHALKNDYDLYILTTDTDHGETEPYPDVISNKWITDSKLGATIFYAQKKHLTTKQLKEEINRIDADYIYLNHLFSPMFVVYPLWLKFTGKLKTKFVVCPRGALYKSALTIKLYKKKPFLLLFKWMGIQKKILFHATNEREQNAILEYFPGSSVCIADNLPNMNQPDFLNLQKDAGHLKCIFVARIVSIKNLLFLLNALDKIKAKVELTVIGPVEDAAYWEDCKTKIHQLPENIKVEYIGTKRNEEVIKNIQQNHLFILPTTGENFGHAIFEAMLAGRPVLISDQTPWLNLQQHQIGWDVPLTEPEGFVTALETAAGWDQTAFDEYAKNTWYFANRFINNPSLKEQYIKLFA